MYQILTYPLDVIKTNRILETSLSKQGAESIPREFVGLFDRGGFQMGLMRGMAAAVALKMSADLVREKESNVLIVAPALTLIQNPVNVLQVHRQTVTLKEAPTSYLEIGQSFKNPPKFFTLGVVPTFMRNLLILGLIDQRVPDDGVTNCLVGLTAVLVTHPFEVARVHMQYHGRTQTTLFGDLPGTYKTLYKADGVAGIFRGLIPRTIQMTPLIAAWSAYKHFAAYEEIKKEIIVQPNMSETV